VTSKTSDWVIQEIGMAVGRGLDVILLVENGIRDPGGLQGDIEYIPFEREHPEKSFNKILEMLSVLAPKATSQLAITSDATAAPEEEVARPSDDDYLSAPEATWSRGRYEMAAMSAIGMGAEERLRVITEGYKATDDASVDDNSITWDAMIEYFRLFIGKGGKLDRLKDIAEKHPNSARTLSYLATIYDTFNQHTLSADTYMRAYAAADKPQKKAEFAGAAVKQFSISNQSERMTETLKILRKISSETPSTEAELLNSIIDLAERDKNQDAELAALERLLELEPDNHNNRFNLAFKHSDHGNNELAIYHYQMIPAAERSAMAWNNLGAAFDQLSFPAKAVESFKRGSEMGETLAMSNLANKLLNVGFVEEAQANLDKALAASGTPHKNVGYVLTALQDVPEEEEKKQSKLAENVRPRVAFLQQLGLAVASNEPENVGETWQAPDCVLNVSRDGNFVKFSGSFERANPLGGLIGALGGPIAASSKSKLKLVYSGVMRGRAVFGMMSREREGATLMESAGANMKALMFFSEDGNELFVMEKADTDNPTYERLRRIQLLPTRDST
jgi:tetratricopeptide (TPR) repeat protein